MIKTLVVDNFRGSMTIFADGDINSGNSYVQTVSGQNPFFKPGNLTWNSASVQIDPTSSIITDLVVAGKERVENGISYVYCIGHTGRLYKIQVNDPTTYNPNYDNPVLLTTLTSGSPTFTRGGFMDFFGNTEKIYISHDKGVTSVNFDGTGEAVISGTWTQNVPKPLKQFVGKEYVGNGSNIAEIDSTGTVTSSTKLTPGFPTNSQVRDLDVSPDGNYLNMVVSRLALTSILVQDTASAANSESYIFKWNGTDVGYTAFTTFPSFSINANTLFQDYQYTFGYDQYGTAVYNPNQKVLSLTECACPLPNAISSNGNILNWIQPVYYNGVLEADYFSWGSYDFEVGNPLGFWDLFFLNAKAPQTDITCIPFQLPVANTQFGASSNGYADNASTISKIYFSTIETSSAPSTAYRFYRWNPVFSLNLSNPDPIVSGGYYQTQTQLFSKKVTIKEVRIYGEPWVAGNVIEISLIGSLGNAITGSSKTFTAGTNLTIGDDFAWYTPDCAPTYAIGVAISTTSTTNYIINKIEIDVTTGGK